ncbi:Cytochrome P450 [Glarea lozoyensis ATCC 20868]|uniref:Cytochrome P450 n=1 Tax=Glarea lozoyensis (strain ATCC 20868 / MF5171) TaxID=1116229 RepID=S3CLK8_GLAL2|nr:Cytochrome P450 [Glarea lozoyensis ATCC 20868]EPE26625.1 Cytochrome P450 [Glarea lozoyensis ATCC 20868]
MLLTDEDLLMRLGLAALLLSAYPIFKAIYNLYFHPLASFPGPSSWAASRLPYVFSLLTGTIVQDIEKLHRKYGPILRVAPNEVTFAHPDAWNDIFQDPLWWGRSPGRAESIISAEGNDHARIRKLISYGFTPRALRVQEPIVQKYVSLFIEKLSEQVQGQTTVKVDVVPWFNYYTFDLFGELGFGESFNCLQNSRYHPWITLVFNSVKAASFVTSTRFYPLIEFVLMKCIPASLKKTQEQHFQHIVDKVERRLNWEVQKPDIMSYIIEHNEKDKSMTLGEIQTLFSGLVTAGSETTATFLAGTVNHLVQNPMIMATLVSEIRQSFDKESDITFEAMSKLPYLTAVINEGLRLCPPVPVMLPRVVPEGGDTVCGLWMPEGTSISIQAWSLFRDPTLFHRADEYLPQRWLEAENPNSQYFQDRRDVVTPFSLGPRGCLGKDLAWAEIRLVLIKLLWTFDLTATTNLLKWENLRTFLLVEKKPVEVNIKHRSA